MRFIYFFDDFDIGCLIRVTVYDFQIWVFFRGGLFMCGIMIICDELIVY